MSPDAAAGSVDSPSPGHVVFARTWFPSWRAWVDGAPARVLVANARDLAVAVPPGRHTFEFSWDRRPFHRGVLWQGAAVLAALGIAFSTRRRMHSVVPAPTEDRGPGTEDPGGPAPG